MYVRRLPATPIRPSIAPGPAQIAIRSRLMSAARFQSLPSTAVGKDFLPEGALFAKAPSGSGFQVSLYGLAGILLAAQEGLEVNVLGLNVGLDAAVPALKLPAIGRLGLDR